MNSQENSPNQPQSECGPLLEACTPLVYRHNAFRVSGLPVDASMRDIKRRIDDLKHAEELDDATGEQGHAFALNPPPSLDHIREAAQRLHDPERRIIEEFFWFWPMEFGKGKSDLALSALGHGDKDAAFEIWAKALRQDHTATSIVAKHNMAVMYQLVALDSEHVALETALPAGQRTTISHYWRACFKWWEELTGHEAFWSLVTDRIRMLDDQRLTTGFARRMRVTLPEAMDKINAMLAIAFIEKGKVDLATNHITYMKETHQGLDDVPKTLGMVSQPLRVRIQTAVENAKSAAAHNPAAADKAAFDLIKAAHDPVHIIELLFPPGDPQRTDICDAVANTCLDCYRAFARATGNWVAPLSIIDKAVAFASSTELKADFRKTRDQAAQQQVQAQRNKVASHPKVQEIIHHLQRIGAIGDQANLFIKAHTIFSTNMDLQAKEIYQVMPRLLAELARTEGKTSEIYAFCADFVAGALRGRATALSKELSADTPPQSAIEKLAIILAIHDQAASLACGAELKSRFREDEAALGQYRFIDAISAVRRQLVQRGQIPAWTT